MLKPVSSPYTTVGRRLVSLGYSAVPVMPESKIPGDYASKRWHARRGWQSYGDRLPTVFELDVWETWPDAGVCLVLDQRIKVVDIDTDDEDICAALAAILPDSPVKKLGSKGFSAFYRGSPNVAARSFTMRGERLVDLLAYGKQTVIPPTVHPDTRRPYHWLEDGLDMYEIDDLPELPDDIADKIVEALEQFGFVAPVISDPVMGDADTAWREVNDIALQRLDAWVLDLDLPRIAKSRGGAGYRAVAGYRPSGSGKATADRNLHLSIHPDGIVDFGDDDRRLTPIDLVMLCAPCSFVDAFEWLRGKLGLDMADIDVSGLIANGLAKQRASTKPTPASPAPTTPLAVPVVEREPDPEPDPTPKAVRAPAGTLDPFNPVSQGGILGAISEWVFASAWRPVAEFATIGAIATCSALFGRRYATPTGLGLNLYLIGIAGSGFGKDQPLKASQALLADAGMQHLIGPGDISSDSALEHVVRQRPCFMMPMDEIGVFLQATGGRNSGGYERRIRKVFLDLYTKGDGMWTGKQKVPVQGGRTVNDNAAEPVYNPCITIMGMSTPTEFYAGISDANLTDGMVGRMTVIAANKRPAPREDRVPLVPTPSLVAEVKRVVARYPSLGGNLSGHNWRTSTSRPAIHTVPWESDAVRKRWAEIESWQLDAIDEDPGKDGVIGRAAEQTLKLATIRACSRAPEAPAICVDDIEWGWAIVSASLWNIDAGVAQFMVANDFERVCKDIVRHVEQAGGSIAKSQLLRKRGMMKEPRLLEAAFQHLAESDVIFPVQKAGRVKVVLKTEEGSE
jgi:hypothetical protein